MKNKTFFHTEAITLKKQRLCFFKVILKDFQWRSKNIFLSTVLIRGLD